MVDALSQRTHEVYEVTMSQTYGDLLSKIKIASINDVEYGNLLNKLLIEEVKLNGTEYKIDQKGLIWFKGRIYMPNVVDLKMFFLNEMHKPPYAGHLGYQKMIIALRKKILGPD